MGATVKLNLKRLANAYSKLRVSPGTAAASSRRSFLRNSTLLGAAGGGALLLSGLGEKAMALDDNGEVTISMDRLRYHFRSIQGHENDHTAFLTKALGKSARPVPTLHNIVQPDLETFVATSQALENTGTGAYLGALPLINATEYVSAAGSIALIEARHSGFLNVSLNDPITGHATDPKDNESFESTLTIDQVVTNASPYIRSLNGGPALTFSTKKSDANDVAILNFALALEQLESAYYNVNVKRFFPS